MNSTTLVVASSSDLERLLPLVRSYHEFEEIQRSDDDRRNAVTPLLGDNAFGRIWMILQKEVLIGYIVLCFGYSIEYGGRDAFLDEFYLVESARGQGIGRLIMRAILQEASSLGIQVVHLEVARSNSRARRFYESLGFMPRARYHLMSRPLE